MNEIPQYIVGFDLGDGESSIAIASTNGNDEPELFDFGVGAKSQITAIARDAEGEFLIGEEAIKQLGVTELYVCFKSDPSDEDVWRRHKTELRNFVEESLRKLIKKRPELKGEAHIYIGHPSAWSEDGVKKYAKLLEESVKESGFSKLTVVPESRAAFIQVRDYCALSEEDLLGSVLLIDIGSSTTDFTYLNGLKPEELPLVPSLGSRLIDEEIFQYTLNPHLKKAEFEEWFKKYPPSKNLCRYLSRKAKEAYFTALKKGRPNPTGTAFDPLIKEFKPTLDRQAMEVILTKPLSDLENRSWQEHYRHLLTESKTNPKVPALPKVVVLTGGGSRMPFTEDICRNVFGDRVRIQLDDNPSFCISKGLAGFGRWNYRLIKFRDSVEKLLQSEEVKKLATEEAPYLLKKFISLFGSGYSEVVWRTKINNERNLGMTVDEFLQQFANWLIKLGVDEEITREVNSKDIEEDDFSKKLVESSGVILLDKIKKSEKIFNEFDDKVSPLLTRKVNEIFNEFHINGKIVSFKLSTVIASHQLSIKLEKLMSNLQGASLDKTPETESLTNESSSSSDEIPEWLKNDVIQLAIAKLLEKFGAPAVDIAVKTIPGFQNGIAEIFLEEIQRQLKVWAMKTEVFIR
jgi:hypothetical protein